MSETVKHTPGPWRFDDSVHGKDEGIIHIRYSEWRDPEIATMWSSSLQTKDGPEGEAKANAENYANARLIVASTDFLTASEALLVAWEKLIESLPQDDRIEEIEFKEFMALRSAVAKALGINSWEVGKYLADKDRAAIAKAEGA